MKYASKTSILVVNYNGGEELRRTLEVFKDTQFQVIVVDNGSKEGVIWSLEKEFPDFKFIYLSSNHGFAKGVNYGMFYATREYVYLVNPDTVPYLDKIERMIELMEENPRIGAMSGFLIVRGEKIPGAKRFPHSIVQMSGILKNFFGFRKYAYKDLLDVKEPLKVESVTGTFMMLRRESFYDVGMFDERFFLYMEDIDLCRRLWMKGWEVWFIPEVLGLHLKGDSYRDMAYLKYHHIKSAFKYFMKWGNIFEKSFALLNTFLALPLVFLKGVKMLYPPWKRYMD